MTLDILDDESEKSFADQLEEYLIEEYGEDNVERNKYLSKTERYVDLWVDGPVVTLAIEVENDFEATFKGVGQTIVYSKHKYNAIPIVMIPEDHVEQPEKDMLNENVRIIEVK